VVRAALSATGSRHESDQREETKGLIVGWPKGQPGPAGAGVGVFGWLGGCRGQAEPVLKAPLRQAPHERPIPAYEPMQARHRNRDTVLISFSVITFD
jgi:hypothetical protein